MLDTVSMVAEAPDRGAVHGSQHCFSVTTPKRTFYLLAESAEEMREWMDAIELNVFLRHLRREKGLVSMDYVQEPARVGRRAAVSTARIRAHSTLLLRILPHQPTTLTEGVNASVCVWLCVCVAVESLQEPINAILLGAS